MDVITIQLLIHFYKQELKRNPQDLASRALLARNRAKLKALI